MTTLIALGSTLPPALPAILAATVGAVLGAVIGSWLATLALRWPMQESASGGRSRCDHCGQTLALRDLVPLASWLWLKGRCGVCRQPIHPLHPAMEAAAAAIGAIAFVAHSDRPAVALTGAALGWALLVLAVLDMRHFWLPDRITAPLAAAGLALATGGLGISLQDSLIGGIAGFGSLSLLAAGYRTLRGHDGLGAGDPKLLGAIGLWTGWEPLPWVVLGAALLGISAALVLALARKAPPSEHLRLPLGTMLAASAWPIWLIGTASGG